MSARWHLADQKKLDAPLAAAKLRELASTGRLQPTDLVRPRGLKRWIRAGEVAGLFSQSRGRWYYLRSGEKIGPVSGTLLRRLAQAGTLHPTDMVWRDGLDKWRKARCLVNLFTPEQLASGATTMPGALVTATRGSEVNGVGPKRGGLDHDQTRGNGGTPGGLGARSRERAPKRASLMTLLCAGLAGAIAISAGALSTRGRSQPDSAPFALSSATDAQKATATAPEAATPIVADTKQKPSNLPDLTAQPAVPVKPPDAKPPTPLDVHEAGRRAHDRYCKDHLLASEVMQSRARGAVAPLLQEDGLSERPYQVYVIESDVLNTCSHSGGYIYVSRRVFDLAADETELAWALGHEIAHVELDHGAGARGGAGSETVDGLAARFHEQLSVGHSAQEEFAADEWITRKLRELGCGRRKNLAFLRRCRSYMLDQLPKDARDGGPRPAEGEPERGPLNAHWRMMPSPQTRLMRIENAEVL
jgi:hypothetical protein